MQLESFLKFYTAFAEDRAQERPIEEAAAEKPAVAIDRRALPADTFATVLHIDKFGREAKAN